MFYGCKSLKELDLSNFNTIKVEYMQCMFSNCISLKKLNISNFIVGKNTIRYDIFDKCNALQNSKELKNFLGFKDDSCTFI